VSIAARLRDVTHQIRAASDRARRAPPTLIAVSKTHPPEAVREAYAAGQRDFGENYVQELVAKARALADLSDLRWHFIGHLQRNKVKDVLPIAAYVHTVDRLELARELEKRATTPIRVLVEVNVGREPQKSGVDPSKLPALWNELTTLTRVVPVGLMAVPPAMDDAEATRPFFAELRRLASGLHPELQLSMGMSHDFEVAIEEGATMVRVGTAIFGPRS
jgi:pyridoxal phosphate enzyme (YggS family)